MNDRDRNRYEMHLAVLGILDTHADAWASAPVMQDYRDQLAGLVATVRDAAKTQGRSTKSATAVKDELRDAVADRSWRLAQALAAYARTNDLPDLAAAVDKTRRDFQALTDTELANYSEVVVAEAREHLPADGEDPATKLGRHGVTSAFVDDLDALDDQFAEALSRPREAAVAVKGATRAIAVNTRKAQTLMKKKVDPTVAFLAPDHPAFAQAYRDARIIVDRGRGPAAPEDADPDDL